MLWAQDYGGHFQARSGASVFIFLPTPQAARADLGWEGVFAVGAEVAVYKWTPGCD